MDACILPHDIELGTAACARRGLFVSERAENNKTKAEKADGEEAQNCIRKPKEHTTSVTTAKTVSDIPKILSLYDNKNTRLIAFCMGDIGKVSRLLSLFLGSPFTYVSLGKPIAAGQLKLDEVKSMLMRSG